MTSLNDIETRHVSHAPSVLFALCIWALSILYLGCDDPAVPTVESQDMMIELDQEVIEPDQEVIEPDQEVIEPDQEVIEPRAGWIEINLTPVRSFYTLADEPELEVTVFDMYGEPLSSAEVIYRLNAPIAHLRADGEPVALGTETSSHQIQLELVGEGFVELTVCSAQEETSDICATRPFLVDDSAPSITVLWPPRGIALSMEDPWVNWSDIVPSVDAPLLSSAGDILEDIPDHLGLYIPVYGQVFGLGNQGMVTLNGKQVTPNEEGYFSTYLESSSQYQEISFVIDDGVRFSPVVDRRWVLLTAGYIPHEDGGSRIGNGIEFSLQQSFIDNDSPFLNDESLVSDEIAQLLDLFLGLIDPNELITQSTLINTPELTLSIDDLSLGRPDIDLQITNEGLSLLLSLNEVTVNVTGGINIGASEIDLSGALQISLSAFSDYSLEVSDAPLEVEFQEGAVVITRITPNLNEEAANAVISVVESTARTLIIEQIEAQVLGLIDRDIPLLLESAVRDVYQEIQEIPLVLSTGLEGSPDLSLMIQIEPTLVTARPLQAISLGANVNMHNDSDPAALFHLNSRGIPQLTTLSTPNLDLSPVSFRIKPEFVNGILTEVWRNGLLELSPPLPASAVIFFSEVKASALTPPLLSVAKEVGPYPLYLELGALRLELTQSMTGAVDVYEAFLRVGAELVVDGGTFTVRLEDEPMAEVSLVTLGGERAVVTEGLISSLLIQQVWPSLSAELLSRLSLGIPDALLDLSQLSYLGVDITRGQLRPRFSSEINYREDWITMSGRFLFDFQQR